VAAVSAATRDQASAGGLAGVTVVPNGVDIAFWSLTAAAPPSPDPPGPLVGFVGRLSAEKGAIEFVRTAAAVAGERPDCRFLVAGEGPLEPEMRRLAGELGLDGRMTFAGLLDPLSLRRAYAGMTLLLISSHTEGLPFSLLEAMSMEVPVVATRVGGIPEAIEDGRTGILVPSCDIGAMARGVFAVLGDPSRGAALAAAARRKVEESFSLEAVARRWESVYLECAAGRRR
jgi:glycosyltransferase involved in cell wall biosynthesis